MKPGRREHTVKKSPFGRCQRLLQKPRSWLWCFQITMDKQFEDGDFSTIEILLQFGVLTVGCRVSSVEQLGSYGTWCKSGFVSLSISSSSFIEVIYLSKPFCQLFAGALLFSRWPRPDNKRALLSIDGRQESVEADVDMKEHMDPESTIALPDNSNKCICWCRDNMKNITITYLCFYNPTFTIHKEMHFTCSQGWYCTDSHRWRPSMLSISKLHVQE